MDGSQIDVDVTPDLEMTSDPEVTDQTGGVPDYAIAIIVVVLGLIAGLTLAFIIICIIRARHSRKG